MRNKDFICQPERYSPREEVQHDYILFQRLGFWVRYESYMYMNEFLG